MRYDAFGFQGAPQRFKQALITDVAHGLTRFAGLGIQILQGQWLNGYFANDGGLQKVGVKGEQIDAITRRPFWENGQNITVLQSFAHVVDDAHGIAAGLALYVQGASACGQSAEYGPMFDVSFTDEATMLGRMHDQDI
jgi:hypothetical protein